MADSGKDVPAVRERPSLIGFEWLWTAFMDLDTCRGIGMSAGPIPWTAVQRYAEVHQFGDDEVYMLHRVIRAMDRVWSKHQRNQQKQAAEKPRKK